MLGAVLKSAVSLSLNSDHSKLRFDLRLIPPGRPTTPSPADSETSNTQTNNSSCVVLAAISMREAKDLIVSAKGRAGTGLTGPRQRGEQLTSARLQRAEVWQALKQSKKEEEEQQQGQSSASGSGW